MIEIKNLSSVEGGWGVTILEIHELKD